MYFLKKNKIIQDVASIIGLLLPNIILNLLNVYFVESIKIKNKTCMYFCQSKTIQFYSNIHLKIIIKRNLI